MKRFGLDAEQADAILELKLYRLARLEILVIQNELADKRKRARQIAALLKDEEGRWTVVRDEIEEIQKQVRRQGRQAPHADRERARKSYFTADDFIVEEDNVVIVSRDGWVKRQKEVKDLSTTRLREGDAVLAVLPGSTRATVRVLHQLRRRPTRRASLTCPRRPATASRCRSCSSSATASGWSRRSASTRASIGDIADAEGGRAAARPCRRRHERRLQPALQLRAVRRAEHAGGPPLRAAGRGRRGGRRRARHGRGDRHRGDRGCARAALPRRRDQLPVRAGQGRHPDQADRGRGSGARLHRLQRAIATCCASKRAAAPSRQSARRSTRSPVEAARGANCSSGASSPGSSPTTSRTCQTRSARRGRRARRARSRDLVAEPVLGCPALSTLITGSGSAATPLSIRQGA